MARIETWFEQDLSKPVEQRYIKGNFFSADNAGNLVGVKCYKDGAEASLSGSVTGYCVLADGTTVPLTGTRSGNQAYIIMNQTALSVPGLIGVTIQLIDGTTKTTLLSIMANVYQSKTDAVVTPSQQIITDWANQINAALQTVTDASAAQDEKIDDLKSAIDEQTHIIYDGTIYERFDVVINQGAFTTSGAQENAKELHTDPIVYDDFLMINPCSNIYTYFMRVDADTGDFASYVSTETMQDVANTASAQYKFNTGTLHVVRGGKNGFRFRIRKVDTNAIVPSESSLVFYKATRENQIDTFKGAYNDDRIIDGVRCYADSVTIENGAFNSTTGDVDDRENALRTGVIDGGFFIYNPNEYDFVVARYANGAYVSTMESRYSHENHIYYIPASDVYQFRVWFRRHDERTNTKLLDTVVFYRPYESEYGDVDEIYEDEIDDTVAKVKNINKSCVVFGVVADTHITSPKYQSIETLLYTLNRVNDECRFDAIIHLGDLIHGGGSDAYEIKRACHFLKDLEKISGSVLVAVGNHEDNMVAMTNHHESISLAENYNIYERKNRNRKITIGPENELYYYVDYGPVRVIVLNGLTGYSYKNDGSSEEETYNVYNDINAQTWDNDHKRTTFAAQRYGYSNAQINWVRDVALDTDKAVLFISHFPISYNQMVEKYNGSHILAEGFNGDRLRDEVIQPFKDAGGTVIGLLHGHYHFDYTRMEPSTGVTDGFYEIGLASTLIIGQPTANKIGSSLLPEGVVNVSPVRMPLQATRECWTVCAIDLEHRKIKLIRFGGGSDQEYTF